MDNKLKEELKDAAKEAVCTMIDQMFIETEVNDDAITVSIAGHDIKGYNLSLNQYSTQIDVNGSIITHDHKYIRYPNYFGAANRILIKQLAKRHMDELKEHIKKDPIDRVETDSQIWEQLRMLEDGIRTLESTGFNPDGIQRVLHLIRTGVDPYRQEEEPIEAETPPEEQPREFVNPEAILDEAERRAGTIREARRIVGADITEPPPRLEPLDITDDREEEELPEGYTPDELVSPTHIEIAQDLMRAYLNNPETNPNGIINDDAARDLLELATFEDVPLDVMSREINAHNLVIRQNVQQEEQDMIPSADQVIGMARDEAQRQELNREMQERRAQVDEYDPTQIDGRINHDEAAARFIQNWYEQPIDEIGIIDQQDYNRMITNIETTEPPGVYLFALDRVIGAHNANVSSGRDGLSITAYASLDGTPQRINIYDAAARHFAHITGCNNPDTDSIGRYVDDEMRQTLYRSGNRNNIPQIYVDWAIDMWNNLHRDEDAENWEIEQGRQSDIFITANFSETHIIPEDVFTEMTHRAELFGIDPEIFMLSVHDHNRRALNRQEQLNREVDEIADEDLQAAADRYDNLTHSPLTRDRVPPTTEERMMRNGQLNPNDPAQVEVFEMRDTTDERPAIADDPERDPHNEDDHMI